MTDLTVFVGTFNRLTTLERTVRSYANLTTPHRLVIVDNGTTDPECRALLERLLRDGEVDRVVRCPQGWTMPALTWNFEHAIRAEYDHGKDGDWYAVSEADVCFDGTAPDALDAYIDLAAHTGYAVGPHTRVDAGIPACYPLRSRVLATEARLLYADAMEWHGDVPYSVQPIDTTFHCFPRRRDFPRLRMNTLRCGPPYDAMHLDWYLNIFDPEPEQAIYMDGKATIGSWGRLWIMDFWRWFQFDREVAFERLLRELRDHRDLDNNSFMLSWCYQYGHGVEANEAESVRWLDAAIPAGTIWPPYRPDYLKMIYDDDFACLGW